MVFSSSEEEHVKNVDSVLQRLRDNNLFSKASKCVFHASSVEDLGCAVSSDGLRVYSSKVQQILNWPQPNKIKALQSFLGFANFYCCFIKYYSKTITALTSLLKTNFPFIFNEDALSQFQMLKEAFTNAPILSHFNPFIPTILETDVPYYALGAVLSQLNNSGKHPIASDICKLLPAELNFEIHEKELLGIVWAQALKSFPSFSLQSFGGRLATLPDALSRWDNMYPERGVDFINKNPQNFYQVIKQEGIQKSRLFSYLVYHIQREVWQDKDYKEIIKQLPRGELVSDYSPEPQAKLLLIKDRVLISSNEEIQLNIL
ncbi:hypothetical protein O181_047060 [Austropuccinia psidii MF-1]|uniref:Reverse transcriptase/retrotransposon-derived protein RNase H-like domain-containing protein n=1 Tax=Austropuccinia psidii MF-1 TaxID=1389203 RepID=A0A9Q3DPK3_9BASI|nr:hypothetical protein [Austropuccinia psidii MF-1]